LLAVPSKDRESARGRGLEEVEAEREARGERVAVDATHGGAL
jgi:hypothetical protein